MTRVYLPCDGLDCPCADHVDTETHVPVCPLHGLPLVAADRPGVGQCLWTEQPRRRLSRVERITRGFNVKSCGTWGPASWVWRHRDGFNGDDLPPYNGWKPVDVEALT